MIEFFSAEFTWDEIHWDDKKVAGNILTSHILDTFCQKSKYPEMETPPGRESILSNICKAFTLLLTKSIAGPWPGCASICASSYISITLDVSRIYSALLQDPFLQLLIFSQIWDLMKLKEKNLRLEKAGRAGPWAMRTAPWGRRNRLIIMLQGHFRDWENFLS